MALTESSSQKRGGRDEHPDPEANPFPQPCILHVLQTLEFEASTPHASSRFLDAWVRAWKEAELMLDRISIAARPGINEGPAKKLRP